MVTKLEEPRLELARLGGSLVTAILLSSASPAQRTFPENVWNKEYKGEAAQVCISPLTMSASESLVTRIESPLLQTQNGERTSLGRRLMELRTRALASGMRTSSRDEILEEIRNEREER
jgi:hypothetical protein